LGVGLRDVSDDRLADLKLKDARGVEVIALDHDGPAAKVGMKEHDVILQMNGQEVASGEQLRRMLRETPAGRKATFALSRDGQPVNVEVVLGDRSQMEQAELTELPQLIPDLSEMKNNLQNIAIPDGMEVFPDGMEVFNGGDLPSGKEFFFGNPSGVLVESMGAQLAKYFGAKDGVGLLVKEVVPDTAAAKSGFKAGDVIVRVEGQPMPNRRAWDHVLRDNSGKSVAVEILRDKHPEKLTLAVAARTKGALVPESFVLEEPEVDAQLDPQAVAEVEKAVDEVRAQMDSREFKKQLEDARTLAEQAVAEWNQHGQAELKQAQEEAQKAVEQWKQGQPDFEKQVREAAEQAKHAAEDMQLQFTPMD
jgi:membrane-associated protease RseP (regulator of RpoE activity)